MNATSLVVLASASTVRASLLTAAGVAHVVDPAALDEAAIKRRLLAEGANAARIADELAARKAEAVSLRRPGALVLGADQTLECAGRLFDKPRSRKEAQTQLEFLSGREHRLCSAVATAQDGAILWRHTEVARMTMRELSAEFLDRYLAAAGESVLQGVGGYQLEGLGAQLFERVEGDIFTVLGLPLLPLLAFLRQHGVLAT